MVKYAKLYAFRNQEMLHRVRLEMVLYALEHSIKAAARKYEVSRNTVRLWVRRYEKTPHQRLVDERSKTSNHPQKMKPGYRLHLVNVAKTKRVRGQRVIATQLKQDLKLPYSVKTIIKVLRQEGLWGKAKPKAPAKQDLRHITDAMAFGQCIQVDIKYLSDVEELKLPVKRQWLPRYQFTARDRATGALWLSYGKEKSSTNTTLFIEYLLDHLKAHGVSPYDISVQTDNGPEFTVWHQRSIKKTLFEQALAQQGVEHRLIQNPVLTYPRKRPIAQATSTTLHPSHMSRSMVFTNQ